MQKHTFIIPCFAFTVNFNLEFFPFRIQLIGRGQEDFYFFHFMLLKYENRQVYGLKTQKIIFKIWVTGTA